MKPKRISISPLCYVAIAIGLLIVPARWLVAWVLAVSVHEICHCVAMLLLRIPIYAVDISISGAKIHSGYMSAVKELFCALAGPGGAMFLLIFARYIPCTAVCVIIQTLFNMLPIYPFDGGRILKCITECIFGSHYSGKILDAVKWITHILLVVLSILLSLQVDFGLLPLLTVLLLTVRTNIINRPCKLPMQYSTIKQSKE